MNIDNTVENGTLSDILFDKQSTNDGRPRTDKLLFKF